MADLTTPALPRRRRAALNPRVAIGGAGLLLLVGCAVLAPLLAPHDPLEQDLFSTLLPPSWLAGGDPAFPLGTDGLGRDVLSRLIYSTRVTVVVALVAATLAGLIGSILGLVAGYAGRAADQALSRLIDVWMAFPPVLLSIVLAAVLGAGLGSVIAAIVVIDWTRFARVVRAETMVQARMDYVTVARSLGLPGPVILMREILPNLLPLILTLLAVEMGIAVIVEAILSFVGLSVAGDTATWGGMIAEGRQVIRQAWWVLAFPMGCLVLTIFAFTLFGDGLRAAIDPVRRR
ncbi:MULTISPECIES: ABC transporter permease [unclassified Inquilinus]|uniref:ABC transporter permease n=1 Tax=unclassified Inquilinus TaxID=2645927 RepID=UPI003F91E77D